MNTRRLYQLASLATLALFIVAAVLSVAGVIQVALALIAVGLAASVAAAHLRSRFGMSQIAGHAKRTNATLAAVQVSLSESQGPDEAEMAALLSEISTMSENLELNLAAYVASSESVILADLLTLRQRINRAVEYAESSTVAAQEWDASYELRHPLTNIEKLSDGGS